MKLLAINCQPDLSFFTKRGLILDVKYGVTYQKFPTIKTGSVITADNKTVDLYSPDVFKYLDTLYKNEKYDVILFGWKPEDYGSEFSLTGGQAFGKKLSNGAWFATTRQDGGNYEAHELMHLIGKILYNDLKKYDAVDQMDSMIVNGQVLRYYKNDQPSAPDSNWAVTWDSYKKYLPELNNLGKEIMPTYKYFTSKEIVGLKPELVAKLDEAREIAGVPFVILSGLRDPDKNEAVGGVENSAHLTGEATDIKCIYSVNRLKMIKAFLQVGFTRIGIGKDFIHVDISKTLPSGVCWTYYK